MHLITAKEKTPSNTGRLLSGGCLRCFGFVLALPAVASSSKAICGTTKPDIRLSRHKTRNQEQKSFLPSIDSTAVADLLVGIT